MSDSNQHIGEVDVVAFKKPIGKWPAGTTGTVIDVWGGRMTIDIANDQGETIDMPRVPPADLELVEKYS
jgi:hypothetical protein